MRELTIDQYNPTIRIGMGSGWHCSDFLTEKRVLFAPREFDFAPVVRDAFRNDHDLASMTTNPLIHSLLMLSLGGTNSALLSKTVLLDKLLCAF